MSNLEGRITELELRFMHQEATIQELNDTVYRQEQIIMRLERSLGLMGEQLQSMAPSMVRAPDEDERPPHY